MSLCRAKTSSTYSWFTAVAIYHSATSRMPLGCVRNGAGTSAMSPRQVPLRWVITARSVPRRRSASARQ